MRRIFLLLIVSVAISAQEPPKPVLVDEFGAIECEDLLARGDNFATELHQNPISPGYVLINPIKEQPRYIYIRRKLVSSTLQLRGFDTDRFRFFLGNESDGKTQFWLLPPSSDFSNVAFAPFDEPNLDLSKPFQVGAADDVNLCPTFVPRAFAQLILQNPGSTGKIEIAYGKASAGDRWGFANDWIEEIVNSQRVPRNRLKLVFAKDEAGLWASFWFIPAKKK